jgi:hypothetical protein
LPAVDLDPKSTDFTYRINRQRLSYLGGTELLINRVSTWQAVRFSAAATTSVGGAASRPASFPLSPPTYAAILEVDVNKDARVEHELRRENLVALFDEAVELAAEIATLGDVQ